MTTRVLAPVAIGSALLLAALLSSCSLRLTIRLTNLAQDPILITLKDAQKIREFAVLPAKTKDILWSPSPYTIRRAGKTAAYYALDETEQLNQFEGRLFPSRILNAVYTADGCIYAVDPEGGKQAIAAEQPYGYPACPAK